MFNPKHQQTIDELVQEYPDTSFYDVLDEELVQDPYTTAKFFLDINPETKSED